MRGVPDLTRAAQAVLASLDAPPAKIVEVIETTAYRAEIAQVVMPQVVAHQTGFDEAQDNKAENVFANVASGSAPIIEVQNTLKLNNGGWQETEGSFHHEISGMTCPKELVMVMTDEDGEKAPITAVLSKITVYDEIGNDTSCDFENKQLSIFVTLYASNWPDVSLIDHFGASLKLIVDRFSLKSEATVAVVTLKSDETRKSSIEGKTRAAAFITHPLEGVTFKTALWLNKTDDWHVKARATYPVAVGDAEPQFSIVELVAAIMHSMALLEVDMHINDVQAVEVSG